MQCRGRGRGGRRLPARLDPVRRHRHAGRRRRRPAGIGSGNIGATNVLRSGRTGPGAGDPGRRRRQGRAGGAGRLAGHPHAGADAQAVLAAWPAGGLRRPPFPVWLGFKGGKGVATFFGMLLAAAWPVGLGAGATWIAVAAMFRISSLAALTAAAGRRRSPRCCCTGHAGRGAGRRHGRADLHPPRAEHPPPAEGRGAADRRREESRPKAGETPARDRRRTPRDWLGWPAPRTSARSPSAT